MTIELRQAAYTYADGSHAVRGVDLHVDDGERVAVVGQNGAGKTTTVKMMNGLLKPTAGDVLVDGESTAGRTAATVARSVGYVFQNPDDQLFSSDVRTELEYMPRYYGWDEQRTAERVDWAADVAGVTPHLGVNPKDLPFATRKFVAIAAVLVGECRHVVLDEPTAGLDVPGQRVLEALIDELGRRGISVVTITHDMRFVVRSFPRVVAMAEGTVVADGGCADLFADDAVLARARIRRPEAAQLARDLGLGDGSALTVADVARLVP